MQKLLRCYAERHEGRWEAFCVDFDIAVQGSTFEEVYRLLNIDIADYIGRISELATEDQKRLLRRRAPVWTRLRFLLAFVHTAMRSTGSDDDERHGYTLACTV